MADFLSQIKLPKISFSPVGISKTGLGIDIGTDTVRIVELSGWGERRKLENYGQISAKALYKTPFRTFEKSSLSLSASNVAKAITAILQEARMKSTKVVFAIPDFSTFFTSFNLPAMNEQEIKDAVEFEARRHIPLPLSEVTLDWQIVEGHIFRKKTTPLKILLVSVPNEIIYQYQKISSLMNLKILALEAEVFTLQRSLIEKDSKLTYAIIDIGARSSTVSIVEKGILKLSHSFDASGNDLTAVLSKALSIGYNEAESLKIKSGLEREEVRKILLPITDSILAEAERIFGDFYQSAGKKIERIILAGSSAMLPGLVGYCSEKLKIKTKVGNCFSEVFYPPILEETLSKMSSSYAIAVGAALRRFG